MWNALKPHLDTIAAAGARPQGAPAFKPQGAPPPHAGPPPQGQPMPPRPMPPQAPPPQAAPPPPQGGPPQPGGPPLQAGGADPHVTQLIVQRVKSLTPQEGQAFFDGISVPALQVLKKILPEISPAIDSAIQKKQGGMQQGAPNMQPAPPPMQQTPPNMQQPPPRPPGQGLRQIA